MKLSNLRPSPALIVAMTALVVAMSGAALALPGKGSVGKNDIKNGAVTAKKIARGAIGSKQIKGKSIRGNRIKDGGIDTKQLADDAVTEAKVADGAITGAKVANESLSSSKIGDYAVISSAAGNFVKLTATEAATAAAARTAAPETELFTKGQIKLTAKCFRDTAANETTAEIYVKSTAPGAIFSSDEDSKPGGNAAADFLNPDTGRDHLAGGGRGGKRGSPRVAARRFVQRSRSRRDASARPAHGCGQER